MTTQAATAPAPSKGNGHFVVPPKLTKIGAGLILLLGALTAVGPFTIDLYLAAFPQITADMNTQPAAVQLTITPPWPGWLSGSC